MLAVGMEVGATLLVPSGWCTPVYEGQEGEAGLQDEEEGSMQERIAREQFTLANMTAVARAAGKGGLQARTRIVLIM